MLTRFIDSLHDHAVVDVFHYLTNFRQLFIKFADLKYCWYNLSFLDEPDEIKAKIDTEIGSFGDGKFHDILINKRKAFTGTCNKLVEVYYNQLAKPSNKNSGVVNMLIGDSIMQDLVRAVNESRDQMRQKESKKLGIYPKDVLDAVKFLRCNEGFECSELGIKVRQMQWKSIGTRDIIDHVLYKLPQQQSPLITNYFLESALNSSEFTTPLGHSQVSVFSEEEREFWCTLFCGSVPNGYNLTFDEIVKCFIFEISGLSLDANFVSIHHYLDCARKSIFGGVNVWDKCVKDAITYLRKFYPSPIFLSEDLVFKTLCSSNLANKFFAFVVFPIVYACMPQEKMCGGCPNQDQIDVSYEFQNAQGKRFHLVRMSCSLTNSFSYEIQSPPSEPPINLFYTKIFAAGDAISSNLDNDAMELEDFITG